MSSDFNHPIHEKHQAGDNPKISCLALAVKIFMGAPQPTNANVVPFNWK